MGNINRIQTTPQIQRPQQPGQVDRKYKQDAPKPGVTYAEVHRSEGDPEETIQAILHFTREKIQEKRGGKKDG